MEMTLQNLPFFYLIWITIGVVIILIGIFMLVYHESGEGHYTSIIDKPSKTKEDLEGILSYFLEEEEKKNQSFREMLESYAKTIKIKSPEVTEQRYEDKKISNINEITKLADEGIEVEEIARKLGKGVGEVQLILSLYKMR